MKINSITKLCILALINNEKLHGYEILKEVGKKTGIKLSASHVYPFLKELEKNNFVVAEAYDRGGHEKNVYQMTKKGKRFYRNFMNRFSIMLESGIKNNIKECHHCGCEVYKNHYHEIIKGKRYIFCCMHCAKAYKQEN
ncbi:helix-turn-helix transcriptional regulator [Candidatus Pacearchaeota archaeon]|nr:helix-turn-helix transcriptional regulator [Candidatus Pacearchaeota archaeon]